MLSRRRFLQLATIGGGAAFAGGAHRISAANTLEVTRTNLALPGDGPGFTMVVVADIHAPQPSLDIDGLMSASNAEAPDLVLIVGDSINRREDLGLLDMYSPLQARVGKFSIAGNWENWALAPRSALRASYDQAGVRFLDNESLMIPELGLRLVGLDERTNGRPDWSLIPSEKPGLPTLVMHHSPGSFDLLPADSGAGYLMLSGHTHGGQIAPLGRPLVLPPGSRGYVSGSYAKAGNQLYVSRGIGNSHIPVRVGSRPELAILRVERPRSGA